MSTPIPRHLLEVLEQLDYIESPGLLIGNNNDSDVGPRDYLWRDLHLKIGLDAAFFHDGVPLVGFSGETDASGLQGLRRRLWNYGRVPVLITTDDNAVTVYNAITLAADPAERANGILGHQRRSANATGLIKLFSRREVEAGVFATKYASSFRRASSVDRALFKNLAYLRDSLEGSTTGRREAVDALIEGCIIASYLADRGVLNQEHLAELAGAHDLRSILHAGHEASYRLFRGLAERFNGDVFDSISQAFTDVELEDLLNVASLLNGDDLPTGQQSLWPYDFSVLPVDLVSSVYEQLLESNRRTDSAYYTPRFLVDVVLDELLPWQDRSLPTIIDLACGSGAFMTEAFRRLVYRERTMNGVGLTYERLQDLLVNHIFGVDINPGSARIAVFGLYLALLEELDPPTVWTRAVLPKLIGTNVIISDAFESHQLRHRKFDIVVGNPPWASRLTPAAARYVKTASVPVADKQLAHAFLWLAAGMLKPSGQLGLVMPAKATLHNRSRPAQQFRRELFEKLDVKTLVDLSVVRRNVFATAIAPAAVVVAGVGERDSHSSHDEYLIHVAAHERQLSAAVDALVVTPEEIHTITCKQARVRPDLWKVLLWGSQRDLQLLDRLAFSFPSVGDIVSTRKWVKGQGFQVGGGDSNDASELVGMPVVKTDSVLPLRIFPPPNERFSRQTLHRPRSINLYRSPQVLVRRTMVHGRMAAVLNQREAVVFNNGVIGFSAPPGDTPLLAVLAAVIVSSLGHYWHFMTSASWGVERDFVELNEHLSLPLATPTAQQGKKILDFLNRTSSVRAGSQEFQAGSQELSDLDEIIFELYSLSEQDVRRIKDRLAHGLERFRRSSDYAATVDSEALIRYADTVRELLQRTLPDIHVASHSYGQGPYRVVAISLTDSSPPFASPNAVSEPQPEIDLAVRGPVEAAAQTMGVIAQPAGFFVDEDTIYLVKTADSDRWSYDAALDDADRILASLAFGGLSA